VIFFQNKPVLKEVLETVEEMAERLYGPRRKHARLSEKRRTAKRKRGGDIVDESPAEER